MSWSRKTVIRCCWGCVAPVRHVGCHATCERYAAEKEVNDRNREVEQLEASTYISDVEQERRQTAMQSAKDYKKRRDGK